MFYIVVRPQHTKVKNSLERLLYKISLLFFHTITFSASKVFRMYKNSQAFQRGAIFSAPVQTGPQAHPASSIMGTGAVPSGKATDARR
jgi:hypothetical protein